MKHVVSWQLTGGFMGIGPLFHPIELSGQNGLAKVRAKTLQTRVYLSQGYEM